MKDFFSILNHLLQAYIVSCVSLLFKEKMDNLQVSRFVLKQFFAVSVCRAGPINAITWKIFSPVSWDPGIAIPGSRLTELARLSCNRKVDFCCV